MTETSKTILEKYQVRKTKKQKSAFIEYVRSVAEQNGYECNIEKGTFGARNIVVGSPESAKTVYTAHYDTCPRLPFPNFITPKNIFIYLLYQILIVAAFFAVSFLIGFGICVVIGFLNVDSELISVINGFLFLLLYFLLMFFLFAGPANKHTANDNTSGVATLLDIMASLPQDSKANVAFVFFDLEETGLFGSASFASKHKKYMQDKLLLNFDCVSDGDKILLAVNKKAKGFVPLLEEHFQSRGKFTVEILSKGVFYPSDQANFKCGVGVAALKYSKLLKTDYMDRIHTEKDVIFQEENIAFLTECSVNLASAMKTR